jgi:Mrp family chromosome partitioning ATPase
MIKMKSRSGKKPAANKANGKKSDEILFLVQRLSLFLAKPTGRIVTFTSARPGEGVSTISRNFARTIATEADHKVLLIDAGQFDEEFYRENDINPMTSIADTLSAGKPIEDALFPIGHNIQVARWTAREDNRSAANKLILDQAFWMILRESFGTVVIDAPSRQLSADGIGLAARADAAVIVVEAESTRQPVIDSLIATLNTSGAKIAGLVMNRRRFYIPERVYKRM